MVNNFLCLIKEKQCACARCGIEIRDSMFGAIGYESDHIEENYHENDDSNKNFWIGNLDQCNIYATLNEIVKTQLTCGFCYYRVKYSVIAKLPKVLTRKCDAIPPRAVSVYLDSDEGKSMLVDFNQAWHADDLMERLSWQELQAMTSKFGLALEDIAYITKGVWNDGKRGNKTTCQHRLCRVFINAITHKLEGCLFCGAPFSNLLSIQLMGIDFHHIMEAKKSCGPIKCAYKSPRDATMELRKTCTLCRLCHAKVTHSNSSLSKFLTRFEELGYKVDKSTGYVVKEEESKRRHEMTL
jgi:hypothetical protein